MWRVPLLSDIEKNLLGSDEAPTGLQLPRTVRDQSGRRDHVRRVVLRPAWPELPLPGRRVVDPGRSDRPGGPVHR
jgi:hypothetical protein